MEYLLDTNIVSFALKNNPIIKKKLKQLESQKNFPCISCISFFEIKKGLLAVKATRQIENFE